jgi:hypothetical protein
MRYSSIGRWGLPPTRAIRQFHAASRVGCTLFDIDNGKPVVRRGRKAMGPRKLRRDSAGRQATERKTPYAFPQSTALPASSNLTRTSRQTRAHGPQLGPACLVAQMLSSERRSPSPGSPRTGAARGTWEASHHVRETLQRANPQGADWLRARGTEEGQPRSWKLPSAHASSSS